MINLTRRISECSPTRVKLADCDSDRQLIELWLHDKAAHTAAAYRRDIEEFRWFLEDKPLNRVMLNELMMYADALEQQGRKPATIHRKMSTVKSVLTYGLRIGYLTVNVGSAFKLQKLEDTLSDRILSESQVLRLIDGAVADRDKILLRFLYETGCRCSELVNLTWNNLTVREYGGQVRIFGKGGKTRNVLVTKELWDSLQKLRKKRLGNSPVFASFKSGKKLSRSDVNDIVAKAAERAGIPGNVSPHWLRHAHASHSIERGCPIHLTQQTLGHSSLQTTGRYLHARPSDSSARYLPR